MAKRQKNFFVRDNKTQIQSDEEMVYQQVEQVVNPEDEMLVDLAEVKDRYQVFFEKYRTIIFAVVGGIALLILGSLAYNNLIKAPKEKAAAKKIFRAEAQFASDSFSTSLNGVKGAYAGFADIIADNGGTNTGNLARLYAAIDFLHLGDTKNAIKLLNNFSADGDFAPILKNGLLGDAYSEEGKTSEALTYYRKAASLNRNDLLTPYYLYKAGLLSEHLNKVEDAKKLYQQIRTDFPNTSQARDIEKHLIRLGVSLD